MKALLKASAALALGMVLIAPSARAQGAEFSLGGGATVPLADFGLDAEHGYQLHDLLSEARYLWQGAHNFVTLAPESCPAHIFRVRRRIRREQDFEYFL